MSFATHELLPACQLLFDVQTRLGTGFLDTLHEDLLKSVFRKRAFETHPDRAHIAGLDPLDMTRRFQEVQAARDLLSRYLVARAEAPLIVEPSPAPTRRSRPHAQPKSHARPHADTPPKSRPSHDGPSQRSAKQGADFFWGGSVPDRQLPIGEYLYYCGRISLQSLIAAIHAQRTQRPVFGQIALQRGFLNARTVALLLANKRPGERLGDAALRFGLLSPYQRDVILGTQRLSQRLFGHYFASAGLLSARELSEGVRAQRAHNFGRAGRCTS